MRIVKPTKFGGGTIKLYPDGQVGISCNEYTMVRWQKSSYFIFGLDYTVKDYLENRIYGFNHVSFTDTLYIYPNSRVSRDLIRQSGYKITRDKDKADHCIVPWKPRGSEYDSYHTYNIVAITKNDEVYSFVVNRAHEYDICDEVTEEEASAIQKRINDIVGSECEFLTGSNIHEEKRIRFMPYEEAYYDIFMDENHTRSYIYDSELRTLEINKISPETLDMWKACEDDNILEKSIMQSDWREYPVTLSMFLAEFKHRLRWTSNYNMKLILQVSGAKQYIDNGRSAINTRQISPKDFDMLQSYILHMLHVSEEGGYATFEDYDKLPRVFKEFMRTRLAVKPLRIKNDELVANLKETIKVS